MPSVFDVTVSSPQVALNASGQAEVSFTISNKLGTGVGVRATVEPTGTTPPGWLAFPEGAERSLTPDGTAVLPVRIAAPAGTAPGTYGFSLVVASQSNPDEHYVRSPSVAFSVAVAAPVKKRFPWWIVALAAGVLLLVGGVVAVLASRGGAAPGAGQPCATKAPVCADGLHCAAGTCQTAVALGGACAAEGDCAKPLTCFEATCRGGAGFKECAQPGQCVTGRCEAKQCQEQETLGDACDSADDCRAPLACSQGFCLIPVGQRCTHPSQCVTGTCTAQTCSPSSVPCPRCPRFSVCRNGQCEDRVFIHKDPGLMQELAQPRRFAPVSPP